LLLLLIVLIPLAGCGTDWLPDNTKPNAFSFTTKTGVAVSTLVESDTVTVSGNSTSADINVINGEFKIDDKDWTIAPGKINAGSKVKVRHTSAATNGTATTTALIIGGVSATFTSITVESSNIAAYAFPQKTGVELATVIESDPVTISGTGAPWPISITGGEYSIDNGTYTSVAGTINNLQSVKVRHTSASTNSASITSTLKIENRSADFTSVTKAKPVPFSNFSTFSPSGPLTFTFADPKNILLVSQAPAIFASKVPAGSTADPLSFSVTLSVTNTDLVSLHTFQGQLAGLDSQNRKIHPGYFLVSVGVPAGASSQSLTVTPVPATMSAATFNSITHWVFRQISAQ
jgi:hypothetical protein